MKEVFKSIDTQSLVDKVEDSLIALLHQRKLKVGDSIPKELELAAALGVSRTVVREALMRLRMMGLIDTKKKKGAVITSPDIFGNLAKSLNPYILSDDTLKEIFEIRLVLEVGMADLLFSHVTDADIKELKEIVKNEPLSAKHRMFEASYEIAFHGKLYQITKNETLKKFQGLLLPIFDFVEKSSIFKPIAGAQKFTSHKQLITILEKGTPEEFRNGMRSHLENHFARLRLNKGGK
ncbi:FadR/GntR family transcriptional regulator [Pinibacter aurantiacus]|uniref:FadR family transcriptional regulator n=1 Tax=Pinibacter aurantiacus TaxID=2851599 RepID=A0A9E2S4V6_9BACT|nr:FadR/GntR family transcriptional regulator [Pinibacter aurantiacus]MBV4355941.1 FadR family transcriptional regulator [Pinibacter aurantiacus]MDH7461178.1 FadR/GntR family transcriptional regulator [Chitinophagaceae bacterium 26-R-25]